MAIMSGLSADELKNHLNQREGLFQVLFIEYCPLIRKYIIPNGRLIIISWILRDKTMNNKGNSSFRNIP